MSTTPKNWSEFRACLQAEVDRASAYSNPYEDSPFAVLGVSPDYIRGGKDALQGVIRMVDEIIGSIPPQDATKGSQ